MRFYVDYAQKNIIWLGSRDLRQIILIVFICQTILSDYDIQVGAYMVYTRVYGVYPVWWIVLYLYCFSDSYNDYCIGYHLPDPLLSNNVCC